MQPELHPPPLIRGQAGSHRSAHGPHLRTRLFLLSLLALAFEPRCITGYAYSPSAPPSVVASPDADFRFESVLSPYGEWIFIEPYGRVWRPYRYVVGNGFMPYVTGGDWVYTDYGWMFDTRWDWGWVPFHYGRWFYAGDVQGWVWVPDTVWGPAWVEWRAGGGYVGWAPLPPPVAVGVQVTPSFWVFVSASYFPDGRHHGHVEFGPHGHPATAVIPPRHTPDGHAWYSGPSRDWVAHNGSVNVSPRPYRRPAPPSEQPGWGRPSTPEPINPPAQPPAEQPGWSRPSTPEPINPPAQPPIEKPGWGRPSTPEPSNPPAQPQSGGPGWGKPSTPEPSNPPAQPPSGKSGWGKPSTAEPSNPPAQPHSGGSGWRRPDQH